MLMEVGTLRELLRNLQAFQSLREDYGTTEITGPDGTEYSIYDIEYLYSCRSRLSPRQRQAIELFLYHNIREREVAEMMGVAPTNPIAIYATQGLTKLCEMINRGQLPHYRDGHESVEV
jgi:DNA-directed RNA polymerase specialized sigma24 family protein